jgi:hypothetical protein
MLFIHPGLPPSTEENLIPSREAIGAMSAERQGVDPPQWALQPIPDVTVVGSPIKPTEVE